MSTVVSLNEAFSCQVLAVLKGKQEVGSQTRQAENPSVQVNHMRDMPIGGTGVFSS